MVWLTAELRKHGFETTLITGTVPPSEGDMAYFAREAGVEPLVIKEMSRELSPLDVVVVAGAVVALVAALVVPFVVAAWLWHVVARHLS